MRRDVSRPQYKFVQHRSTSSDSLSNHICRAVCCAIPARSRQHEAASIPRALLTAIRQPRARSESERRQTLSGERSLSARRIIMVSRRGQVPSAPSLFRRRHSPPLPCTRAVMKAARHRSANWAVGTFTDPKWRKRESEPNLGGNWVKCKPP